jgi:hypothetical protein
MATFPTAIDSPIGLTLVDVIDPSDTNEVDARVLAVEAKVGIDNSTDTTSLDYKVQGLLPVTVINRQTNGAGPVVAATIPVPTSGRVNLDVWVDGTMNDGTKGYCYRVLDGFVNAMGVLTEVGPGGGSVLQNVATVGCFYSCVVSISGTNVIVTLTGGVGEQVNWHGRIMCTPG